MKLVLFFFSIFFTPFLLGNSSSAWFSAKEKNKIVWNAEKKLEWKNFKGVMPANFLYSVNSGISLKVDYKIKKNRFKYTVNAIFSENDSYFRNGTVTTTYILNNEQRHFDIAEIYARILRKKYSELASGEISDTEYLITELYKKFFEELKKAQVQYDSETNRSMDFEKQEYWNGRIDTMLDSLYKFR